MTSLITRVVTLCFFLVLLGCGDSDIDSPVANGSDHLADDSPPASASYQSTKPNIVIILADDMGYGDLPAYNQDSRIPTPNMTSLAAEGMRFSDAHSPSAVCTPTRYGILTGRYAWRTKLKRGVTWGYSPLLINPERETIPSMLKKLGYHTAGIGKWHLGMGDSEADFYGSASTVGKNDGDDFGRLRPGPNEVGFDYFFGIPASLDMKPYVYVENGRPYTPLTGKLVDPSGQRRFGGGGFWRKGQIAEGFDFETVLPTITEKATDYIHQMGSLSEEKPFLLYFALTAPHTPWMPTTEFQGKSGAGYYGDFVTQVDDTVGQILTALDEEGFTDNTLLIVASDNGAHWLPADIEKYEHLANGNLRGQKADIHEGGHRIPLIVRWPGMVDAGSVSDHPLTLGDFMATFAEITGANLDDDAAPDSFSVLPTLLGDDELQTTRPPMIHHSANGTFAIRNGDWKLIEGLGSGGFTPPETIAPTAGEPDVQLYNLRTDPDESDNVAAEYPSVVEELQHLLDQIRASGSSTLN